MSNYALGVTAYVGIKTCNIGDSVDFWCALGFKELERPEADIAVVMLTDGSILLELACMPEPFFGIIYYTEDIKSSLAILKVSGAKPYKDLRAANGTHLMLAGGPDKLQLCLISVSKPQFNPQLHTVLQSGVDITLPPQLPNPVLGIFGEFTHSVPNLKATLPKWNKLGFTTTSLNSHPYPWAIVHDGIIPVGLHQYGKPGQKALTYFAPDMADRIAKLPTHIKPTFLDPPDKTNACFISPEGVRINMFGL